MYYPNRRSKVCKHLQSSIRFKLEGMHNIVVCMMELLGTWFTAQQWLWLSLLPLARVAQCQPSVYVYIYAHSQSRYTICRCWRRVGTHTHAALMLVASRQRKMRHLPALLFWGEHEISSLAQCSDPLFFRFSVLISVEQRQYSTQHWTQSELTGGGNI